jgi:HK97 family phage portal protein
MSLFFRRSERRSADWSDTDLSSRNTRITPERAVYLAPVFASLRHIVDFASTLPIDSYRVTANDGRQPAELPAILQSQEQLSMPGIPQWIGQAMYGLAAYGNAVGYVAEADSMGQPTLVHWLKREDWNFEEFTKQWFANGTPVPTSRILHIPWIVPPGWTIGLSPIEHYAAITRAGLSAQEYADVRRGGGIPPSILKNNKLTLDTEQAARVREQAMIAFASSRPFVTGADWDLSVPMIPPSHAQFIATLKLSATQIAAIYGIDPREIGGEIEQSLTYTNDESRALNRAANMRPYLVRLESAVNRVLPEAQRIKLNVDATIRTDTKTRVEIEEMELNMGTRSVNEVRALEDRPPVPGGDFYNIPAPNTEPINRQGETS